MLLYFAIYVLIGTLYLVAIFEFDKEVKRHIIHLPTRYLILFSVVTILTFPVSVVMRYGRALVR